MITTRSICTCNCYYFKIGDFSEKKVKLSWQLENKINHGLTALFGGFTKLNCDCGGNGTNLSSILWGYGRIQENMLEECYDMTLRALFNPMIQGNE